MITEMDIMLKKYEIGNSENRIVYIYTLCDSFNGIVRYIGKTNHLKRRYLNHKAINKNGGKRLNCWIKSINNNNLSLVMEVLDVCSYSNWIETEKYWIAQFKSWGFDLVNATDGGDGNYGIKRTLETQLKINKTRKERGIKPLPIVWTNELKKQVSDKLKEKRHQPSLLVWTSELKKKVSDKLKGIKKPIGFGENLTKIKGFPVVQKTLDGIIVNKFDSAWEAVRKTGIAKVHYVCNKTRKTAGGYLWEYLKTA